MSLDESESTSSDDKDEDDDEPVPSVTQSFEDRVIAFQARAMRGLSDVYNMISIMGKKIDRIESQKNMQSILSSVPASPSVCVSSPPPPAGKVIEPKRHKPNRVNYYFFIYFLFFIF